VSHTDAGIDLVGVAKACRFAEARFVADMGEAPHVRDLLHHAHGPVLIQAHIASAEVPRVIPTRDGHELRLRFMRALKDGTAESS